MLLMTLFFLSLGLTMLALQWGGIVDIGDTKDTVQAKLLAETALQEARYYVFYIDNTWVGTSPEFVFTTDHTIGTYQYTVAKKANVWTVTAVGYVPNSSAVRKTSQTLSAQFRNPSPLVLFTDGFELNNLNLWAGQSSDPQMNWDTANTMPNNLTNPANLFHGRASKSGGAGVPAVARLLSPVFDLSQYDTAWLRFSYGNSGTGTQFQVLQNSTGLPGDWVAIFTDATNTWASTYSRPAQRVQITTLSATTQFRFDATLTNLADHWYLDDVQLTTPYAPFDSTVDPMQWP